MSKTDQKERLKDFFDETLSSSPYLQDNLSNIDYYSAFCKSIENKKLYKMLNCNLCMFKYVYRGEDSIIIIFGIPSSSNPESKDDNRHMSQKVMELLKIAEDCFINVDYSDLKEIKEDKFYYLTMIKSLKKQVLEI
jgi:hypothetical protein